MTRREIFDKTVGEKYKELRHPLSSNAAIRAAIIYAVQNTDRIYYEQPKEEKEDRR